MADDTEGVVPNKLWMGDLEPYMDEAFLRAAFAQFGYHVQTIKWIRNHQTGTMARYCFVEFNDPIVTRQILEKLNNQFIPGTNANLSPKDIAGCDIMKLKVSRHIYASLLKKFKLNWASRKMESGAQEYNIFVADLSRDVTSQQLLEFFQKRYKSVRYAKVIEDEEGVSKGYGFVRFMDEGERSQSYSELDGSLGLGRKAITIKPALAPKRAAPQMMMPTQPPVVAQQPVYPYPSYYPWPPPTPPTYPLPSQLYSYPTLSYEGYSQTADSPAQQSSTQPAVTQMYVEDLEDPNPPLDIRALNAALFQQDKELYVELEQSRWNSVESTSS